MHGCSIVVFTLAYVLTLRYFNYFIKEIRKNVMCLQNLKSL